MNPSRESLAKQARASERVDTTSKVHKVIRISFIFRLLLTVRACALGDIILHADRADAAGFLEVQVDVTARLWDILANQKGC